MATKNDIGKRIYVTAELPATNDTAGFEALTWVHAKYWQTLPQLGVSHAMIDVEDGETGFTKAVKGAASGVETTMTFRIEDTDRADVGQVLLRTQASDDDGTLSVKIVDGTGTGGAPVAGDLVEYAQGIAHSYQPNQATVSSFEGFQVGFRQNDFTVPGTEPA